MNKTLINSLREDWTRILTWVGYNSNKETDVKPVVLPANVITMPEIQIAANNPPNDTMVLWQFGVDGSEDNRHNVRVLCDLGRLDLEGKNIITACIEQESDFNPSAIGKLNSDGTQDFGICQFNNGKLHGIPLWIGEGAYFTSTEEVLTNPTKCVNEMIAQYKLGHIGWWVSFSSGAYKKFMPQG